MNTLNTLNNGIAKIDTVIAKQKINKKIGLLEAMKAINEKMEDYTVLGMRGRKLKSAMKASVLEDIKGKTDNSIMRVYNIAFTMNARGIKTTDYTYTLDIAKVENLANYGSVAEVNEIFENETIIADINIYLKSLKTRIVTSKTFEKKAKI